MTSGNLIGGPGNTFGASVEELAALEVWARGLTPACDFGDMLLHCLLRTSHLGNLLSLLLQVMDVQVRLLVGALNRKHELWRDDIFGEDAIRHCSDEHYACLYCLLHGYPDLDSSLSADAGNVLIISNSFVGKVAVGSTA